MCSSKLVYSIALPPFHLLKHVFKYHLIYQLEIFFTSQHHLHVPEPNPVNSAHLGTFDEASHIIGTSMYNY